MNIVNGYLCLNCADIALAKKGVDPAKPRDDPANPAYDPDQAKADHGPAFQLSGLLARYNDTGPRNAGPVTQAADRSPTGTATASVDLTV